MAEQVELTDLEVICRWSLAVRAASADRDELIKAFEADLQWLRGERRGASPGAPATGTTPPRTSVKRAAAVRTAAKTPAKKAPTKGTQRRAR
ncbi:MAG TPA: hypothetical protein VFJ21_00210 [Mycobacteriales bacterium]|jgi:hypothetical protein|nr:hypothetical protein [Nocardioidaceae bacterium]HET7405545.1 hypothetical protein [Mycobacteriales bacterium]